MAGPITDPEHSTSGSPAPFLPLVRMRQRLELARDDSDVAYFFELLYLGEMVLKVLVAEMLAAMQDDRDHHRYALEYRAVRAESLGEWGSILDDALTGPASQHIVAEARESQRALAGSQGPGQESWQRRAVMHLSIACRMVDPEAGDPSRQRVSLRTWVTSFVWLRNRTRGHGAALPSALSGACPELATSIEEIVANAPAFQRSWAHLRQSLSGKYKVTSFGGTREPFAYLARETGHCLPDGTYVFLDHPRPVHLLFTDPDLSDFYLPNGCFRDSFFESISYVTDDRQAQDGASFLLPAHAQPASETAAGPSLEIVGNSFTNMPPRREGYVKRGALESELERVLLDDRHPIVTLQGRGGVGKTSLALEVLHRMAHAGDTFAIIWFSARDIDLLQQGPKVVRPDVLATRDIAFEFWRLMKAPTEPKLAEAIEYFTGCLSGEDGGPFVFVFDNFETVRDQAELYLQLDNAIRLPNKVLITTRTRDFKADYPIEVRGMTRDEFAALVSETAARLGISDLLDPSYEDQLFDESDGHPYITKVLLGEVAHERRQVSLRRIVAAREGMLEALFDRSFAILSAAAQRVFLTLCSWQSLVPRIGLEAVLLRRANDAFLDVSRAVGELEQASLVEVVPGEDGGEFLSVPLVAAAFGKRKLVTSPFKIAVEADLKLIREFGVTATAQVSHGMDPQIRRMAKAAAAMIEEGADASQALEVIEYIATTYPPAWLALAELQEYQLDDPPGAIRSMSRYLEARQDDRDAWGRLIRLHKASGDALAEMNARLHLADLERPAFADLSSAATRLNGLLARGELTLDRAERQHIVRKLRSLMEARHIEATAEDLSRLAWLCMHDRDSAAARRWTEEGLMIDPANRHCLSLMRRLEGGPAPA